MAWAVVSVNVGLPQDVPWQGKLVRTAIWKRPVSGRVMARRLNIDGDGQGDLQGHGGENRAVMVYQLESYRYWDNYLQRELTEHGQFGENLTVDGLADCEVCIGDRYRIGTAVFEVTQPRVTCYRVGLRMGHPQMPNLLVSHKRPGFYFRVIEEGDIGAGDEIIKISAGDEHFTVAEIDALLYLPGHPAEELRRALRIPALSYGWKQSFEALLAAADANRPNGNTGLAASTAPPPAWQGFRALEVVQVRQESVDVRSFVLASKDRSALPEPVPGQFVVVRLERGQDAQPLTRSYSISGAQNGRYRISVKRAEGAGSQYMHDRIQAGNMLQVSAPRGSFTLAPDSGPVVLLSAGIGATPMLAMLHWLSRSTENSQREIYWIYGARCAAEHPFAAEARELLCALPHARSFVAYTRPGQDDKQGRDFDSPGRVSLPTIEALNIPKQAHFYLCGPASFIENISGGLRSWGACAECIHSEIFGAGPSMTPGIAGAPLRPPHPPTRESESGPEVSFTRSGLTVHWDNRFQNLLELAEACDVPVRWSCRAGVCHTCETALIGGTLCYHPEPLDLPVGGSALICCARPVSAVELDL
jgi:ferredoxin-NADP reductase/MOSC domain-containing protein YiiM/ferredoxin